MCKKVRLRLMIMIGVILSVAVFLINYYTPYLADDYSYLVHKGFSSHQKISSVADMFSSTLDFYATWGGRVEGYLWTTLFSYLPPIVFDMCNTGAYMAVTWLIYLNCICGSKFSDSLGGAALYLGVHALLWFSVPDYGQIMYWMCGSANYLWASFFVFLMIYCFRRLADVSERWTRSLLVKGMMFLLGIISGWAMENMSAGMLAILTLYSILYHRAHKLYSAHVCGYIGALIGFMCLIFAPGNFARADSSEKISGMFCFVTITYYWIVCVGMLCIIWLLLFLSVRKNEKIRTTVCESGIFLLSAVISAYCMVAAGSVPERTFYIVCAYVVVAVGILYKETKWEQAMSGKKMVITAAVGIMILLLAQMADTIVYSREIFVQTAERETMIIEQKESGNRNVEVPIIQHKYPLRAQHDGLTGLSDIKSDPAYWINVAVADYYGVDSVTGLER